MSAEPAAHAADAADAAVEEERHATNLELFLDLVFVFAVTQITGLVAHDLTPAGVGRGALIAGLAWWLWSQYTWAGAALDLQRHASTRLLVLVTVPPTLLMAIAIPTAYGDGGPWFGAAYLTVQWLVLAMQGAEAVRHAERRGAFVAYASMASLAPAAVLIGGLLDGDARTIAYAIAVALNVGAAFRGAGGEWALNPGHFAERHALFVIIALGEALVAIGATATELGLDGATVLGAGVAVVGACVLWWTYFAYIPEVTEHALCDARGGRRGVLARDLMTLGHFPIVAGIIAYAVVAKHVVRHPTATPTVADRWLLAGAVALILGAYLHIQWRTVRGLAPERLVAIAVVALGCAFGGGIPGAYLLGATAVVVGIAHGISRRRYQRREPAHVSHAG